MSRDFSRDDVLRLAPDAGSAKSGQELAQLRKWAGLGGDEVAIWGECQGSGSKPYQVQIELAEPAFKCSCPSRKFPCKHGIGLLLLYATSRASFAQADRPAWVQEWLAARESRAAKAAEKQQREPTPRDTAAQAKRREKRIDRARVGLADLSIWMHDMVRGGIGAVSGKGFDYFDSQARRMVDAQAPGVARLIRQLGSLASRGSGWQRPFVEQMSLIHLLVRACQRIDDLPEKLRADVESAIGLPTATEDLNDLPATADDWQVIAQEVELEDRLRVQRTWLYGVNTNLPAMVLQFAHGTTAFEATLPVGMVMHGELVFFPGNGPRAIVRSSQPAVQSLSSLVGCPSCEALLERFSESLANFPWLERLCLPLNRVTPAKIDDQWLVLDSSGGALPIQMRDDAGFTLLAIAGGDPVDVAAEYDGAALRPLSVVADGRWFSLASHVSEAA
jgi:hypothetical protein